MPRARGIQQQEVMVIDEARERDERVVDCHVRRLGVSLLRPTMRLGFHTTPTSLGGEA